MANYLEQQLDDNRKRAIAQGDRLTEESRSRGWNAEQKAAMRDDTLWPKLSTDLAGGGGYTDEEAKAIRQQALIEGSMTGDQGFTNNFLNGDERSAVLGDPTKQFQYYNPDAFKQILDNAGLNWRDVVTSERENLTLDPSVANRVRMTDQQKQDIVTAAGMDAGTPYRAAVDRLERQGRAAGVDPLGIMAMKSELTREQAGAAGDALTKARIAADAEQARRELGLEGMRLDANRGYVGMALGNEQGRLGSQQYQTGAGLDTQQYLTTTGMQAARDAETQAAARNLILAENRQGTERANQQQKFQQGTQVGGMRSAQEAGIADARRQEEQAAAQQIQHQMDTQTGVSQQEASRQGAIYGTQMGTLQDNMGRQINYENRPSGFERAMGAITGAAEAVSGFLPAGAAAKAATGGAGAEGGVIDKPTYLTVGENGPEAIVPLRGGGGYAEGGIVDRPTMAMVGENGPEAIVPLNGGPHAKVKPGKFNPMAAQGEALKQSVARMYPWLAKKQQQQAPASTPPQQPQYQPMPANANRVAQDYGAPATQPMEFSPEAKQTIGSLLSRNSASQGFGATAPDNSAASRFEEARTNRFFEGPGQPGGTAEADRSRLGATTAAAANEAVQTFGQRAGQAQPEKMGSILFRGVDGVGQPEAPSEPRFGPASTLPAQPQEEPRYGYGRPAPAPRFDFNPRAAQATAPGSMAGAGGADMSGWNRQIAPQNPTVNPQNSYIAPMNPNIAPPAQPNAQPTSYYGEFQPRQQVTAQNPTTAVQGRTYTTPTEANPMPPVPGGASAAARPGFSYGPAAAENNMQTLMAAANGPNPVAPPRPAAPANTTPVGIGPAPRAPQGWQQVWTGTGPGKDAQAYGSYIEQARAYRDAQKQREALLREQQAANVASATAPAPVETPQQPKPKRSAGLGAGGFQQREKTQSNPTGRPARTSSGFSYATA